MTSSISVKRAPPPDVSKVIKQRGIGVLVSLMVGLLTGFSAVAEEPVSAAPINRPRIGLVLSGGGARGIAHVGVLKVLEELHIPVDAIAGTSMGALVGGLYASGMPASEIERLINSLDWQAAFRDRPSRTMLGFRRKQDDRNFLVRYSLGIGKDGLELPTGLIQGQNQTQILRSATLSVAGISRFDQLPIPFCAIATDLESGSEVVMDSGDLVTAMRASMSAPGVFTPVEFNGRLLVDGGLVNNLPIDIARQMNVDVLIVVDVSTPLYTRDELTSPLAVTNQSAAIMVRNRTGEKRRGLHGDDLLIEPQLGTMSPGDFSRVAKALLAGELAARSSKEKLNKLAINSDDYESHVLMRAPRHTESPNIDFIQTDRDSSRYADAVNAVVGGLRGKPLNRALINEGLASLYALDLFETIDYKLINHGESNGLEFHLEPKSWGPDYVRVGINLEDDFAGNSRYNLAGRLIMTDLNALGAEWLTDIQIGNRPRFATEFLQPLSWTQPFFVAPRMEYELHTVPMLRDDTTLAQYRVRNSLAGVDVGRELSSWGELRVGLQRGSGSSEVLVGDPLLPTTHYGTGGYVARFAYDTLDNVFFPRHGQQFTVQWNGERRALGSDYDSNKVFTEWQYAKSFDRYTMVLSVDAGSSLSDHTPAQDYFTLGGFLNLSGLTAGSLAGPHYAVGRFIYFRQIGRGGSGVLELPAYAGISIEAGNVWNKRSDADFAGLHHDASLFFGADSPLGPVYLAAGVDDRRRTAFYLFLGRSF